MKVLILNWRDITHPQSGGAECFIHEIGKRLAKSNEVTLFCGKYPGCTLEDEIDGIKIRRMGNQFTLYLRAVMAYKKHYFDLVIDDINGVPFFSPIYADARIVPVIHHVMGWEIFKKELPMPLSYVGYFAEKSIPKIYKGQHFVVVSESTKKDLSEMLGVPRDNISIVYSGLNIDTSAAVAKSATPTLCYVGRVKSYKRVDDIIRAFAKVLEKIPDAKLIIAGRGDYDDLKAVANELNITSKIDFRGEVAEDEKVRILSSSWVCLMASMKEGWGLGPMEANICSTPVVAYNVPGIRDSMKDGETAYLVEDGNIDLLAEKTIDILTNQEDRERMSKASLAWASNFTWDRTTQQLLEAMDLVEEAKFVSSD
ncbi:glycosyltransferase family 4 protein [Candidatus Methanomassiliicoccus intestinalis]|uniref:glycosyltransferase family 4 protein n=1 Tax=Candidatus Methanomassiliicoccus intestinalis TaxID=1406512 RepID=UPI0037DD7070